LSSLKMGGGNPGEEVPSGNVGQTQLSWGNNQAD
jgi:hypothetical protein